MDEVGSDRREGRREMFWYRILLVGLEDGGGIEMLARSVSPTVVSRSAWRALRVLAEEAEAAEERTWPEEKERVERVESREVVRERGLKVPSSIVSVYLTTGRAR